ncbi:PAS domain S-box protein [Microcoleus sp. FACHB-1515]|uniref:PAS domain-containing hybrid sensor histidine kinase/response regulator n=1 Tax=Cyanophyceae TaxID=3028117 RepID=UPI0016849019|nr:PAS domain S-box protein [Microcoleus sp. FACHB-1515]MBD2092123.1 PAS domain S-box protein [Microcoleus sp. FACHB-1515]
MHRDRLIRLGIAPLSVAIATLLTHLLLPYLAPANMAFFYAAVTLSAYLGGLRTGLLASGLSLLAIAYLFVLPLESVAELEQLIFPLAVFGFVTFLMSLLHWQRRQAQRRADLHLQALQDSESRYRTLTEALPQLVWVTSASGETQYCNQRWYDYTGLTAAESLGWGWQTVLHPDDRNAAIAAWQAALTEGRSLETQYRLRRADGAYRWFLARAMPQRNADGSIAAWIGSCTDIHDQKQAEQERLALMGELEAKQNLLEAVLQQMPAALVVAEAPSGRIVLTNKQIKQVLRGAAPTSGSVDEYDQYPCYYLNGEPYPLTETPVARSIRTGEIIRDEELLVRCGDGTRRRVVSSSSPIRDADGQIVAAVGTFYDITDRQQMEAALRESEALFRQLADNIDDAFWMVDLDYQLIYTSAAYEQIWGRSRPDSSSFVYDTWLETLHPDDQERINAFYADNSQGRYEIDYRIVRPNGEVRWIRDRGFPISNEAGEVYRIAGIAEDITVAKHLEEGRKNTEEALNSALQKLNFHVENTPLAVIELNRELQVIRWSKTAERVFGWSAAEVTGRNLGEFRFVYEDDAEIVQRVLNRIFIDREVQTVEQNRNYTKTGSILTCEWYNSALLDDDGNLVSILSLVLDITDRKNAERDREQLLQREQKAREEAERANCLKDEFLAVLSHELRSPLNPILGWTRLLQTRKFDQAGLDRALEIIERNAKLQTQLIEDLLDVSRILRGKMILNVQPVNLALTIQAAIETVRLAAEAKSIDLRFEKSNEKLIVSGDSGRLQQIAWNLLSNAIKFTPNGGRVEVKVERMRDEGGRMKANPQAFARLIVSDTGKGISADFLPHVFERFRQADSSTTRSFGGLGLGLAIVRNLVELHGGSIEVSSAGENQGATFTVELPLMPAADTRAPSDTQSPTSDRLLSGVQVLVVDDETDMRDYLAFVLEQAGANVSIADSAATAIALLAKSRPDLLISDIGMPQVDGYELLQQVRQLRPDDGGQTPAIALTAYAGEINQQRAIAVGFQRHLSKPIDPDTLIAAIREVLEIR